MYENFLILKKYLDANLISLKKHFSITLIRNVGLHLYIETEKQILSRFLPTAAIDYCFGLWKNLQFDLHISHNRQSKFGDFRYQKDKRYKITVNGDLSKEAFLVTFIHEVAHLINFDKHKFTVKPHGTEWKNHFKELMKPLLTTQVFEEHILLALMKYFKNPKASSCSDEDLMRVLHLNKLSDDEIILADLNDNTIFEFKNTKYQFLELRRTRILCLHLENKRKYLINKTAVVKKML
jgi:SprT protein